MKIQSLDKFSTNRFVEGNWYAFFKMLADAGINEDDAYEFADALTLDFGRRTIELMEDEDIYDIIDGYLLAVQEHSIS